MVHPGSESILEVADRLLLRMTIGMGFLSVAHALSAATYVVTDVVAGYLDNLATLLSVLLAIVVFPVLIKFSRFRKEEQCDSSGAESYISEVFTRASVKAFAITFIFVMVLEPVSERYFTDLPTVFFLNLILSLALGALCLTFFYLIRNDTDDFDEEQ